MSFAPPSVVDEVLQNVRTLLATIKHSVPLDRELGIDAAFLDRPAPDATARLRVRIVEQIQRYEPRATVRIIEFKEREEAALAGTFHPVLQIDLKGVNT
jgi:phage baseplate assembly protein W